jgi:hypothetical protein
MITLLPSRRSKGEDNGFGLRERRFQMFFLVKEAQNLCRVFNFGCGLKATLFFLHFFFILFILLALDA